MFRTALLAMAIAIPAGLLVPAPAGAQDIAPVISPGQAAQGIFHRSVAEGQAKRIREGRGRSVGRGSPTPGQVRACNNRPQFRAQYGANDPDVRKLEALCAGAGL